MVEFQDILQRARVLPEMLPLLSSDSSCHLVGGALRDGLLHRPSCDFDFTTSGDPTPLAKAFSRTLGGHWFLLDPTRHQSRVLVNIEGQPISYDFAPWRGPDLDEDLRLRDFTLNAMAWKIEPQFDWTRLHDPLNGQRDLARGILRHCSPQVFQDDPLRILRGVRLCSQFQLTLDSTTFELMREAGASLERVAIERVRQELATIFASEPIRPALSQLHDLKLLQGLLGVSDPELLSAAMDAATALQRSWRNLPQLYDLFGLAGESMLVDGFSRAGFFNLAALLRATVKGQGIPEVVLLWRWSLKGLRLMQDLLALPEDVATKLASLPLSQRGQALWVTALGASPQEVLSFIALSCTTNPAVNQSLLAAWQSYSKLAQNQRIPELVPAEWIQSNLSWATGPALGHCLEKVRQAELQGLVTSRVEGENLLKSIEGKCIDKKSRGPL